PAGGNDGQPRRAVGAGEPESQPAIARRGGGAIRPGNRSVSRSGVPEDPAARGHRLQLDAASRPVGPSGSAVPVRDRRDAEPEGDRFRPVRARLETAPSTGEVHGPAPGAKTAREREGAGGGGARLP